MTDRITREQIVGVAVELLARGGLHALAMRRIASELGVQQSALYWHFDNKQQLLGAVADRVVAPVVVPTGTTKDTPVEALTARLRGELLRYPDGAELVATAFAFRLGANDAYQHLVDELERAGSARPHAEIAASVLWHFVLGYVTDEQQHRQAAELGAIQPTTDEATLSADDRFTQAIDLILAGTSLSEASPPATLR
ncbi:MAG TPA: TetR family transcriptional regulator [Ilumatobacter sp.]|nr:TetR family transcriptional regulator [Ilumatobacter sp.]